MLNVGIMSAKCQKQTRSSNPADLTLDIQREIQTRDSLVT
jgi:hypothetical protein